jgi:hypothetical protein
MYSHCEDPDKPQFHNHEVLGSVMLAEEGNDRHNHRFAAISSDAIRVEGGHVHKLMTPTDFFEDHHHAICKTSGLPISVGNGKHVHTFSGNTTMVDGHQHAFFVASLIESPLTT